MSTINPVFTKAKSNNFSKNPISKRDREIQNLLEQKNKLNEQINEIKANEEMNLEIKKDRIKSLNESIQQLEAQVSQIKSEEIEEKNKKNQVDSSKEDMKPINEKDPIDPLLHKAQSYNNLGKLINVVNQKTNQIRTLEGEVRSDRLTHEINADKDSGKSIMLQNAEMTVFQKKRELVQDAKIQISKVEQKINEIVKEDKETTPIQNGKIPQDNKHNNEFNIINKEDNLDSIIESQHSKASTISKSIDIRV